MSKPLISIIVPIYNVEDYIEECISSIVNQTYENIEIILINDGSTDRSGKIASICASNDPRVIMINKKNGGLSDARNVGMKMVSGKYATFIDSDDFVDVSFIETLYELALENDADITQCDNTRNSSNLRAGSDRVIKLTGYEAFVDMMKYKTISPTVWGKLYKVSLFVDNNLDFQMGRLHEDTAVLYRLIYLSKNISCINKNLYYYRINSQSIMTSSYTEAHFNSVLEYNNELDNFIQHNRILLNENIIIKHKALRLLSVLSKLSLSRDNHSAAYTSIKRNYIALSTRSKSLVCLMGIFPVLLPYTFRIMRDIMPVVRNVLGKT